VINLIKSEITSTEEGIGLTRPLIPKETLLGDTNTLVSCFTEFQNGGIEVANMRSRERHVIRTRLEGRKKVNVGKIIVRNGTVIYTKYNLITGLALTLAVRDLTNNSEIELDLKKYNFHYAHISLVDKNCTLIEISDYEKC
jgi:hypothetical protein